MEYEQNLLFTPEGVRDIYGVECEKREWVEAEIHKIMKLYGFQDILTPTFEFFDIFNQERGTVESERKRDREQPQDEVDQVTLSLIADTMSAFRGS